MIVANMFVVVTRLLSGASGQRLRFPPKYVFNEHAHLLFVIFYVWALLWVKNEHGRAREVL